MLKKKRSVVFICVENACRSQIAEGFAKRLGDEIIEVYSAGSHPSGKINPQAVASMKTAGYHLESHISQGIDTLPEITFDWVITMGCGDHCPSIKAIKKETWDIPDPKHMDSEAFDCVRDLIHKNVTQLIEDIRHIVTSN